MVLSLLALLDEERGAIRKLDGKTVARAAAAKEALVETLGSCPPDELRELEPELPRLRAELRRNGVLLAHARSCLTEAVELRTARGSDGRPRGLLRARV
jgi:hypothetical protein